MRVRRRYQVRGQEWRTAWVSLPNHEAARVRWDNKTIEIDPWLKKQPEGEQEFVLRHELLHVLTGTKAHQFASISHGRVVLLGMELDNLIHFGRTDFKGTS